MGDSLTARVKMQHLPSASACQPRPRVRAAFSHLQCANRPFWPLVSKYTIFKLKRKKRTRIDACDARLRDKSRNGTFFRTLWIYTRFPTPRQPGITDWSSEAFGKGKVKYRPSSDECKRDSWIFLDNFSTTFWWNSVIKIVRWFNLINSSNHLTIFLVEFRRKLVEKLSKKIVRLCRPFTLP